jgi:diacylglycerol kinase (ATP)
MRQAKPVTSYLLVVNPASGRGRALGRAEELRSALAESNSVDVVETKRRGFATEIAAERGLDFDRVIAIGGDGTLNEVLAGLLRIGATPDELPALGFLPSGTANAAVQAFGFGTSPTAVARSLTDVEIRPVDVGIVRHGGTERPFLLWFGAGYDAVVIDTLNSKRTGLMGIAGLARKAPDIVRAVHNYPAPDIEVRVDDGAPSVAASVILSNVAQMAFRVTLADAADPFDGRLDLLTVPRVGTARIGALCVRMMLSSLEGAAEVTHTPASRVILRSEGEVPFQLDGEPVGTLPVELRVEPGAVRLLRT